MIRGRATRAFLITVVAALSGVAAGDDGPARLMPGAGGGGTDGSHGWMVLTNGRGQAGLVHVPPRRHAGPDGQLHGTADGVGQPVPFLEGAARSLAAWDSRVYVLFERNGRAARAVGSFGVYPAAVRGRWRFEPGRLRVEPALTGEGDVEGFSASGLGAVALIVDDHGAAASQRRLFVLDGHAWRRASLPEALGEVRDSEPVFLVGDAHGPCVVRRLRSGAAELWRGERAQESPPEPISWPEPDEPLLTGRKKAGPTRPLLLRWERRELAADHSVPELTSADATVTLLNGRVYVGQALAEGGLDILEVGPDTCVRLARLDRVGAAISVVGMAEPARVIVGWMAPASETGSPAVARESRGEVREISLVDGRVEYSGPLVIEPPLSAREFQWLALGLVLLMGAVLLVVLRADPGTETYSIPPGTSLAGSGRRMVAGAIDLAAAVLVAARVMGVSIPELGDPAFIVSSQSVWFGAVALGIGLALGVLGEAAAGRSIGKLLTGCEVVDVRVLDRASPPKVWQALVRNLVKWALSPAALLGLVEPDGRHRGDSLARTAVVVQGDEPENEPPEH